MSDPKKINALVRKTEALRKQWKELGVNIIPERRLKYSKEKAAKC